MIKHIISICCLLLICKLAFAQQNYDVSLISKDLLPYASAVVRTDELNVEVQDLTSTIVRVKFAVTILNKNGDHMAAIYLAHDKSQSIKYVKGIIYDESGKPTGKFSESNFEDGNAWDGFSLFEGTKVKSYSPSVTSYPYTIYYEYEQRLKQSLELPKWRSASSFGVAVEKSSFNFTCKSDFAIRYKIKNMPDNVKITTDSKGLKNYQWDVQNLKAVKSEPYSPYQDKYFKSIEITPVKFTYYGFNGSFTNWNELGKWYYDNLLSTRKQLPEETIQHIKELTGGISDPKLKAKKIYEYMQNKTHYVSVQVGIGGLQPFLASDVDKQNYGDCKALVNYTQALLAAANIESYYCVVQAGRAQKISLMSDYASVEQGNHIILCLPFKNDTTWADCTSETIPFGYLGPFTDDRTVLACTPEGGKLMHTPAYNYKNNLENRHAEFTISSTGDLSGNMNTRFSGSRYEDREEFLNEPQTEQYKMLQRIYPINNMEIKKLDLKQDKSFDPVTSEYVKIEAAEYANLTGNKINFMINPAKRNDEAPKRVINRVNDVYINRGFVEDDEIKYTLPGDFKTEKVPLNVSIEKPFGKFTATMELKGNQLIYKRKFTLINGTYDKSLYADLVDFYQDVYDADNYSATLVKTN